MRTSLLRLCPYRKYILGKERELDYGAKWPFAFFAVSVFIGGLYYIEFSKDETGPKKRI